MRNRSVHFIAVIFVLEAAWVSASKSYLRLHLGGFVDAYDLNRIANLDRTNVQEAYACSRLGENTWIDDDILFSHIGPIGTIFSERQAGKLLILNSWQNNFESISDKAEVTQFNYTFSPEFSISYSTLSGKKSAFWKSHDFVSRYLLSADWTLEVQVDKGFLAKVPGGRDASWNGFAEAPNRSASHTVELVARIEQYFDQKQVLIPTSNGFRFKTRSAPLVLDSHLEEKCWWRNNARAYHIESPVFADRNGFEKIHGLIASSNSAGV